MKRCRRLLLFLLLFMSLYTQHIQAEEQWTWPVSGVISDYFGTRNGKHYGIDVAAPAGSLIVAASDGLVTKSYYSSTYGNVIFIRHTNGFEAVYAHMKRRLVQEGQHVVTGQSIGYVGNTGQSRGAHLHFEVHKGSWNFGKTNAVNPFLVLGEPPHEMVASSSYVVQRGDTLTAIAKRFGMTVDELKRRNQMKQDSIYPNQRLTVN